MHGPAETLCDYDSVHTSGSIRVRGHRVGDFAVRELTYACHGTDLKGEISAHPPGHFCVDHILSGEMIAMTGTYEADAWFLADEAAQSFHGLTTRAQLVGPMQVFNAWWSEQAEREPGHRMGFRRWVLQHVQRNRQQQAGATP
jgi:hypothetical protein